jgi:glycosyltransferase involved in cell wall biosynthesis
LTILLLHPRLECCCGASQHVLGLCQGLRRRGYRVVLVTEGGSLVPECERLGVRVVLAPITPERRSPLTTAVALYRVAEVLRSDRVALIHSHHRWPELLAWGLARLFRVPTVMTCHAFVSGQRALSFKSDAVIAVSEAVREFLVGEFRVPPARIRLIRNVPRPPSAPVDGEVAALRARLGVPADRLVVVAAGRLHREKGFDLLLDAMGMLAADDVPVHAVVAGEGAEAAALRAAAAARRLPVTFAGVLPYLGPLYALADIIVVPSRSETAGLVPLEAAAFGKPVVATAIRGLRELFADPGRGVLVPPENAAELARAIAGLARDAPRRDELGRALRAHVEASYSDSAFLDAHEAVYRDVMGHATND